nr:hypothetical protein TQ38_28815 [Novosphingobium sp. P6W]
MQVSNNLMRNGVGIGFDRRSALQCGARLLQVLAATSALNAVAGCAPDELGAARHSTLAGILLGLVIPATETAGGGNQTNLEFVLRAVDAGLMGTPLNTLSRLEAELDDDSGGFLWRARFVDLAQDRQAAVLSEYDRRVFSRPITFPCPWFTAKALILMAYYTSETGASEQLTYEIAPGRYDRDVPVTPGWRPMSNDYSANSIKKKIAGT